MATKPKPKSKGDRKAKSPTFPYRVNVGNASVTIYRTVANGYPLFMVADKTQGRGQRRLVKMADFDAAKKYAESIAGALSPGEALVAQLRPTDVARYGRALELLRPTGATIELACAQYAKAFEILGGDRVIEAARYFLRMKPTAEPKPVAEAVEEFLKLRATRTNRGRPAAQRTIEDYRSRLNRFADSFRVNIGDVTTGDIQRWLDGLKVEAQTYVSTARPIRNLFQFAETRGWIARGSNPAALIDKVKPATELTRHGGEALSERGCQ